MVGRCPAVKVPESPLRALGKVAVEFVEILCLVLLLRLVAATATEQRVTNAAAHRRAVHAERDLGFDQMMISLFWNKEIIVVLS